MIDDFLGFRTIRSQDAFELLEKDQVAFLVMNQKKQKVNTLQSSLLPEFEIMLSMVEEDPHYMGIVIISGKKDCFVAGAAIEELAQASSEEAVYDISRKGQVLFDRIAKFPKPVIAAIDGICLGGGLELALACHKRFATVSSKTVLGLPEIMLGLLPGAGGTQRLPRLLGLEPALSMILTGQTIKPAKAYKMGLVDYLAYSRNGLIQCAMEAVGKMARKEPLVFPKRKKTFLNYLETWKFGRKFILDQAKKSALAKTRGLYPAPEEAIQAISVGLEKGFQQGLTAEAKAFGRLSQTPESKGLVSVYYAQNETKKNRFGKPNTQVKTIGVIGSGLMGSGIASVSMDKGFSVRLKDLTWDALGKGVSNIQDGLSKRVQKKSLSLFESQEILSRLSTHINIFPHCDLVIEAVFEDLALKHRILKETENVLGERGIFASNTSGLPISHIAKAAKRPDRVIGMHYFSPVPKMPLLEIVVTKETSQETSAMAVDVGHRQGKTVIVVQDGPGFYTTRILAPYMDQAAQVCGQGMSFHDLDRYMKDFGYPVGPMALMDEVGLDVAFHVAKDLGAAFGSRISSQDPQVLSGMIDAKMLGRKSQAGFFLYEGQKKQKPVNPKALSLIKESVTGKSLPSLKLEHVAKRLAYRMMNEAAFCLQDRILSTPEDGDIGAIFGLGFPPFLGGPFRYMDTVGISKVVDTLNLFSDLYGADRFKPCPMLEDMVKDSRTFYQKG